MRSSRFVAVMVVSVLALLVGCGGDSGGGGQDQAAPNAKKADPKTAQNAKGSVEWCIGKDVAGTYKPAVKAFNKANPGVKAKLTELPEQADEQRTQQIQRLRAKSTECDVLGIDVIWTAEYAAQGWLLDVTDVVGEREGEFIQSTVDSTTVGGKNFAVPYRSDAGFLYYRKDQVKQVPQKWEDVYREAAANDGLVYQGSRYEGLTVHFLELLFSAGGKVLSDDGKTVEVNSPEAKKVLELMAGGVGNGVPKAVTTYDEEDSRRAFESKKATFMRNWPYAYELGKKAKIKDDFDIATFPAVGEGEPAGVLGGANLAVNAYTDNQGAALKLIEFLTSPEEEKKLATVGAFAPALSASYDDPAVKKKLPFAADLKKAIEQAKPRPVSAVYPQITEAIYKNTHDVLTKKAEPDAALQKMQQDIDKALKTF